MSASRSLPLTLLAGLVLLSPACKRKRAVDTPEQKPAAETKEASKPSSGNRPPKISKVTISPTDPNTDDDITVSADSTDPDGDSITLRYQWYRNDEKLLGQIEDTLPASQTSHGDKIEVEVTPYDGSEEGSPRRSGAVKVRNSPPTLVHQPSAGLSLDGYRMEVSDPDGDPITYKLEGAPPNMTLDADGTLHWRPQPTDQAGDYEVTLTAADGQGGNVSIKFPAHVTAARPPQPITTPPASTGK